MPAAVYFLSLVWEVASLPAPEPQQQLTGPKFVSRIVSLLLPGLVGGGGTSLVHVLLDTWMFHVLVPARADGFGGGAWSASYPEEGCTTFWPPVVAPLNAARYNAKASNLALHGTHPRWLHAVVNGPIMFGSLTWSVGLCVALVALLRSRSPSAEKKPTTYGQSQLQAWRNNVPHLGCMYDASDWTVGLTPKRKTVLSWTMVVPLLGLSIQPHQEPRCLAPLLAPVCILVAASFFSTGAKGASTGRGWRYFFLLHAAQGIITALFYSYAHQSGVVPSFRLINEAAIAVATGRGAEQDLIWPPMNRISSPPLELSPREAWKTYYAMDAQEGVDSIDLHVFARRVHMPPLHLLRPLIVSPTKGGTEVRVRLHDPPGDDWIDLRPKIEAHLGLGAQHLLIVNGWEDMGEQARAIEQRRYMTLLPQPVAKFLHVDTDHFGELWNFWGHHPGLLPPAYVEVLRAVIAA